MLPNFILVFGAVLKFVVTYNIDTSLPFVFLPSDAQPGELFGWSFSVMEGSKKTLYVGSPHFSSQTNGQKQAESGRVSACSASWLDLQNSGTGALGCKRWDSDEPPILNNLMFQNNIKFADSRGISISDPPALSEDVFSDRLLSYQRYGYVVSTLPSSNETMQGLLACAGTSGATRDNKQYLFSYLGMCTYDNNYDLARQSQPHIYGFSPCLLTQAWDVIRQEAQEDLCKSRELPGYHCYANCLITDADVMQFDDGKQVVRVGLYGMAGTNANEGAVTVVLSMANGGLAPDRVLELDKSALSVPLSSYVTEREKIFDVLNRSDIWVPEGLADKAANLGWSTSASANVDRPANASATPGGPFSISKHLFFFAGAPRVDRVYIMRPKTIDLKYRGPNLYDQYLRVDSSMVLKIPAADSRFSQFGYSLVVADITGDGYDDLVVGAPFYTRSGQPNVAGGAVYVYVNKAGKDGRYLDANIEPQRIEHVRQMMSFVAPSTAADAKLASLGRLPSANAPPSKCDQIASDRVNRESALFGTLCRDSRFGYAVTNIGDIDLDGFNDVAIGAYMDNNGTGAVYIYGGSSTGLSPLPMQRLSMENLPNLAGAAVGNLGFSFSRRPVDIDDNGVPDLLLGSPLSNRVALLLGRTIVDVTTTFELTPSKLDVDPLNLDGAVCKDDEIINSVSNNRDFVNNPCVRLTVTISWQPRSVIKNGQARSLGVPPDLELPLAVTLTADYRAKEGSRVFFANADLKNRDTAHLQQFNITLKENVPFKKQLFIFFDRISRDILTPIEFKTDYLLNRQPPTINELKNYDRFNFFPVLFYKTVGVEQIRFISKCGANDVCVSRININVVPTNTDGLALVKQAEQFAMPVSDRSESIGLNISITTEAIDSADEVHNMKVTLRLPSFVNFDRSPQFKDQFFVNCRDFDERSKRLLGFVLCEVNPTKFRAGPSLAFTVFLNVNETLRGHSLDAFSIDAELNVTSTLTPDSVWSQHIIIKPGRLAELSLKAISKPDKFFFFDAKVQGESAFSNVFDTGVPIQQTFEVTNTGPSIAENVTVEIWVPYQTPGDGQHLLYLYMDPTVRLIGSLEYDRNANHGNCTIMTAGAKNPANFKIEPKPDDTSNDDDNDDSLQLLRRRRRQAENPSNEPDIGSLQFKSSTRRKHIRCDAPAFDRRYCAYILCRLKPLPAVDNEAVLIKVNAIAWNSTFLRSFRDTDNELVSGGRIVTDADISQTNTNDDYAKARLYAYPDDSLRKELPVPIWVYLLAVGIGVVVLLILLLVLYLCGCFKSKLARMEEQEMMTATKLSSKADAHHSVEEQKALMSHHDNRGVTIGDQPINTRKK